MTLSADLLRALAHGLLDVTAVSAILAAAAFAVARIPGVDAGTRSRWWSAVAIVPLLTLAAAFAQPFVAEAPASGAVSTVAGGVLLVDPLDALQQYGTRSHDASPSLRANAAATAPQPALAREPLPWLPIAVSVWLAVAAFRLARVLISAVRAHRLAAAAPAAWSRPSANRCSDAVTAFDAVAADVAEARVSLRVAAGMSTPVAIGLTRRDVVLPAVLANELSVPELRAVVLHEIAHLRRRDDWVHLFERLAAAVLWFDPFVHVALRASAAWRELACDAAAARTTGGRACASALWRSADVAYGARAGGAALALLSGRTLVGRVEALLRPAATSSRRAVAATLVLAVAVSVTSGIVVVRAPAYAWPGRGTLAPTGSMHTRRASFAAVRLRDGRVLIAGGMIANHNFTNAAELYDPARGIFEPTGSMSEGRVGLTGTLLPDGRVLVAGGWTSRGLTATTEIYDPASGTFGPAAPMHRPRGGHFATMLRDGTVLFTGGDEVEPTPTSAEIYDPRRGTFSEIAPMHEARREYTATLLDDGRVLIAGGLEDRVSVRTSELYDPMTRRFAAGPNMLAARSKHGATLLADGSVLITGGGGDYTWRDRLDSAERYNPRANRFVPAGTMNEKRFKLRDATVRLPNGDVLIAGGSDHVELYDAAHDRFRTIEPRMDNARNLASAVLLNDGSVLIAGGYASVDPLPTTETALRYH
jgi:beta-lactamase regulating signal transducer with metallopeptidase domain